ncbi:MFS transporter [Acuticoccus kandeliae]|uniref:MFS transporter n=1 Tax=Acuticoccus kandeliae TaxID=2073160 RepID=UPI0013006628|nr:MFS transporter [Acuticoccus kandeliae]
MPHRRLALLYSTLFFEVGIYLPFFSLWLNARALTPEEIGIVLAAPLLARIAATPLVTTLADRKGGIARLLVVCAIGAVAATFLLAFARGFVPILALVIAMGVAQGPLFALSNALTWRHLRLRLDRAMHEHTYGRIRLWGSVAFIVANLAAGQFLGIFPAGALIWLICGASAATALVAASLVKVPETDGRPAAIAPKQSRTAILSVAAIVAGAAMVQASHATYYAFSSLHWAERGISGATIGALWAGSVVAEVLFFMYAKRVSGFLGGPFALLMLGAGAAVVRWGAMGLDPPLPVIAALQLCHALTFGATHLGLMVALSRLLPTAYEARAQGWFSAGSSALMALLTILAGLAYGAIGEHSYWATALPFGIAALALFTMSRRALTAPA